MTWAGGMAYTDRIMSSLDPKPDAAEDGGVSLTLGETFPEIRESVRALCARFPGEYWRALDRDRAYPTEFIEALTEAGYLAALIPEEYGGSGLPIAAAAAILEEIHRSGGNGAACHAQMYVMGTLLRHGSPEQKRTYLPRIASGELRLQAFGVTEPTTGSDTTQLRTTAVRDGDAFVVDGQKVWISRAEHSDLMLLLARTTPRDQVRSRPSSTCTSARSDALSQSGPRDRAPTTTTGMSTPMSASSDAGRAALRRSRMRRKSGGCASSTAGSSPPSG